MKIELMLLLFVSLLCIEFDTVDAQGNACCSGSGGICNEKIDRMEPNDSVIFVNKAYVAGNPPDNTPFPETPSPCYTGNGGGCGLLSMSVFSDDSSTFLVSTYPSDRYGNSAGSEYGTYSRTNEANTCFQSNTRIDTKEDYIATMITCKNDRNECSMVYYMQMCIPSCPANRCGSDGCSGQCPTCPSPQICYGTSCCTPSCFNGGSVGDSCGSNNCGSSCSCATPYLCYLNTCCMPTCSSGGNLGDPCGSNSCGGTCTCATGLECSDNVCITPPVYNVRLHSSLYCTDTPTRYQSKVNDCLTTIDPAGNVFDSFTTKSGEIFTVRLYASDDGSCMFQLDSIETQCDICTQTEFEGAFYIECEGTTAPSDDSNSNNDTTIIIVSVLLGVAALAAFGFVYHRTSKNKTQQSLQQVNADYVKMNN